MRQFRLLSTVLAAAACMTAAVDLSAPLQHSTVAVEIEREVHRIAGNDVLWPGFEPLSIPLAVFDGERTWLFRHPAPPQGFFPKTVGGVQAHVREGRHDAVTANTSAEIGGELTATLLLQPDDITSSSVALAAVAMHEKFHVFQRKRHPSWSGNEAVLFVYPIDDPALLHLRRLETRALSRALRASDAEEAACRAVAAVHLRHERFARMDPAFADYERMTELNEGLAYYVEHRARGDLSVDLPVDEYEPAAVRQRAYGTGAALAFLLDRFRPDWKSRYQEIGGEPLDLTIADVLGDRAPCPFHSSAIDAERFRAENDVAALLESRVARLAAFESQRGWRIEIESGDGGPLWPQGFDPLNIEVVGEGLVLHGRFLRLGNDSGMIEVLGAEALTEGVGPHPLFNGVRRMVLTGQQEPIVEENSSQVKIRTPGMKGSFDHGNVRREEKRVVIRIGT